MKTNNIKNIVSTTMVKLTAKSTHVVITHVCSKVRVSHMSHKASLTSLYLHACIFQVSFIYKKNRIHALHQVMHCTNMYQMSHTKL